jgi:hypothetical protein
VLKDIQVNYIVFHMMILAHIQVIMDLCFDCHVGKFREGLIIILK